VREVISTWGVDAAAKGKTRYAYLTPDFTLGTSSADYTTSSSNQDEPFAAQLASSADQALITLLADYLDAPGASIQAGDFTKVTHLGSNPVAVQKKGEALILQAVPAKNPEYTASDGGALPVVNLSTNVMFPSDADSIVFRGRPVYLDGGIASSSSGSPTLMVQVGQGVVTVTLISAGGVECPSDAGVLAVTSAPTSVLGAYDAGMSPPLPLGRWAIYAALEPPQDQSWSSCFARSAFLVGATSCPTDDGGCAAAFAASQQAVASAAVEHWDGGSGDWSVQVSWPAGDEPTSLMVARNPVKGTITSQQVDGSSPQWAPLVITGTPVILAVPP
jgi:hypothetical protein